MGKTKQEEKERLLVYLDDEVCFSSEYLIIYHNLDYEP